MFCFKAGAILDEMAIHAPDVAAKSAAACWEEMREGHAVNASMLEIPSQAFACVPDISIDYAVMERSTNVAVVPADSLSDRLLECGE